MTDNPALRDIEIKSLGLTDYTRTWQAMRSFTLERHAATPDQLWLVQHNPVFTLGQAGKREHLLAPGEIPIVESDRGGQVTYHGPGQLVLYVLLDLHRLGIGIRQLVETLEHTVIALMATEGLEAVGRRDAPGVYVNGEKLAALGLRVSKGRSYHGLSLNVDMDLQPFTRINPCGFADQRVTSLAKLGIKADMESLGHRLTTQLSVQLGKICL